MQVSDENYVALMKQKQECALAYFIEKDGWIVKSIICRNSAISLEERQECMNDTFLAVWKNVDKYDETRAAFTTWLAGVTRYCILSYLKKKKHIETVSLEEIWETEPEEAAEPPLCPNLFYQEEKKEFRQLLSVLSPQDQEIFMRLFWEEMDCDQISEELHLAKPVLYNRISRGKKKLRHLLRQEGY